MKHIPPGPTCPHQLLLLNICQLVHSNQSWSIETTPLDHTVMVFFSGLFYLWAYICKLIWPDTETAQTSIQRLKSQSHKLSAFFWFSMVTGEFKPLYGITDKLLCVQVSLALCLYKYKDASPLRLDVQLPYPTSLRPICCLLSDPFGTKVILNALLRHAA